MKDVVVNLCGDFPLGPSGVEAPEDGKHGLIDVDDGHDDLDDDGQHCLGELQAGPSSPTPLVPFPHPRSPP